MFSLLIQSERIWVAGHPIDFRRSIDGLCAQVTECFEMKPQDGIYVFYNARRNRLKLLVWHYNGFMMIYKRLEKSHFPFCFSKNFEKISIEEKALQGLLLGLDWQRITQWKEVKFENYF
jgi:transposase